MDEIITRLAELVGPVHAGLGGWLEALSQDPSNDPQALWAALNSNRFWVGAECVANQTLADNPGLDPVVWTMQVQEMRALLLEIAERLEARGGRNPAASQWVVAFHNWNAAGY